MKKEQLVKNYEDIYEQFFRDVQHIFYCKASYQAKIKMLYGAQHRARYYLEINNHLLQTDRQ
ncbi:MAG TPA: hypothetical protein VJI15_00920 [Candidatus Nanoarchaeia archaeon]|nr:hypothetical protein [Candidatus Nanoarchaeia archaeon]